MLSEDSRSTIQVEEKKVAFSGYLPPQAWSKITESQIDRMIDGHFSHLERADNNIAKHLENDKLKLTNDSKWLGNERIAIVAHYILLVVLSIFLFQNPTNFILYVILALIGLSVMKNPLRQLLNIIIRRFST